MGVSSVKKARLIVRNATIADINAIGELVEAVYLSTSMPEWDLACIKSQITIFPEGQFARRDYYSRQLHQNEEGRNHWSPYPGSRKQISYCADSLSGYSIARSRKDSYWDQSTAELWYLGDHIQDKPFPCRFDSPS